MAQNAAVNAIDHKIQETEAEVMKLRKAAEKLPQLEADLNALKRSKSLLIGSGVAVAEPAPKNRFSRKPDKVKLGDLGVEIIREAGHPLHLSEIYKKYQNNGGVCSKNALAVALLRYSQKENGPIKKTGPNIFGLN